MYPNRTQTLQNRTKLLNICMFTHLRHIIHLSFQDRAICTCMGMNDVHKSVFEMYYVIYCSLNVHAGFQRNSLIMIDLYQADAPWISWFTFFIWIHMNILKDVYRTTSRADVHGTRYTRIHRRIPIRFFRLKSNHSLMQVPFLLWNFSQVFELRLFQCMKNCLGWTVSTYDLVKVLQAQL